MSKVPITYLLILCLFLLCPIYLSAKELTVSDPNELTEALSKASDGDVLKLSPGSYQGNFIVSSDVTLKGDNFRDVIIEAADSSKKDFVISIKGNVTLKDITVKGGVNGILVQSDSKLEGSNLQIIENELDGINFKDDFNTGLLIRDSFISHNGEDGIDLESTQAQIINTEFKKKR